MRLLAVEQRWPKPFSGNFQLAAEFSDRAVR
jgi:hypothetical protein